MFDFEEIPKATTFDEKRPLFPTFKVSYPADAGIIDVTAAPYCAQGDGIADDTKAIQNALNDYPNSRAVIFLPSGTYRITDTLRWPDGDDDGMQKNVILQGASVLDTRIILADSTPGFEDAYEPKAMIWTGQAPAQRFRNAIRDLTIFSGSENPGAIGIQFIANNQGCLRNIAIVSGDSVGAIGLDMSYTDEIGPLLAKNVYINGFDIGVKTRYWVDSITFEHLWLENQHDCGILNDGQCIAIRGLKSINAVPVLKNMYGASFCTLIDSVLIGTQSATHKTAIVNESSLFARSVKVTGYKMSIVSTVGRCASVSDEWIGEYVSHFPMSLFDVERTSLSLPINETPEVPWDALDQWVSPTHFGAVPDSLHDASEAIQRAIDSGKTTVYFPRGTYIISKQILIRGSVRRILGCEALLEITKLNVPIFRFENGVHPVVVFERLQSNYVPNVFIEHASTRSLVIQSCCDVSCHGRECGDLYVEDTCSNPFSNWIFDRMNVWARQFNIENQGTHFINSGSKVWILGYKTERGGVLAETTQDGKTEIIGGFFYATNGPKATPAFYVNNASLSVSMAEASFDDAYYHDIIEETQSDDKKLFRHGDLPTRTHGTMIPLFISRKPA